VVVVTVLALTVDRGDSAASRHGDFLAALPADFTDCEEADLAGDGDLVSAECGEAATQPGPTGARFHLYPDVATLDEVFADDVEGSGLTQFADDEDCLSDTGFGAWGTEGTTRGLVACTILDDDTVSIAWTDDEYVTEGIVSAPGTTQADVAELYTWWVDNSYFQG
jgi:hypothetical protein